MVWKDREAEHGADALEHLRTRKSASVGFGRRPPRARERARGRARDARRGGRGRRERDGPTGPGVVVACTCCASSPWGSAAALARSASKSVSTVVDQLGEGIEGVFIIAPHAPTDRARHRVTHLLVCASAKIKLESAAKAVIVEEEQMACRRVIDCAVRAQPPSRWEEIPEGAICHPREPRVRALSRSTSEACPGGFSTRCVRTEQPNRAPERRAPPSGARWVRTALERLVRTHPGTARQRRSGCEKRSIFLVARVEDVVLPAARGVALAPPRLLDFGAFLEGSVAAAAKSRFDASEL